MNLIDHVDLSDGFNINPIPLEFGNTMTTTKFLLSLQHKINNFIDDCNGVLGQANNYTDEKVDNLNKLFNLLQEEIKSGEVIKDGSISLKKLNDEFLQDLEIMIMNYISDVGKFVWFGLKGDYFVALIPSTWDDIIFSTNEKGCLCLSLKNTERGDFN